MFPRWKYSLFQSWFRRTLAFQKLLAFLSKIISCFTNIFDSKQLKYSLKVYIFALQRVNGNSRRNEPLFLVSVDKLPTCYPGPLWGPPELGPGDEDEHSTKMRCPTNKTSGVSAVQVKLYLVRYILLSNVGRQLVRTLGLNCSLKRSK
jgi:hypothetical protein